MRNVKEYFKPATIEEAVTLLRDHPGKGLCIAGGTCVAVEKDPSLDYLVDITSCDLDYIQEQNGQLRIGACTRLEELNQSQLIGNFAAGILAETARWTGSVQLRNSATVGGRIVSISDITLPLVAMEGQIVIVGNSKRTVPLSEFCENPGKILRQGELITECILPREFRNAVGRVLRMSRTRQDMALVGVAAVVIKDNGICKKARIAVKPVISGVMRVSKAEALLEGQTVTTGLINKTAETLAQEIQPVDDYRASAEYRRKISSVYIKRALSACFPKG
jgi:2-furoyl-CoA dehydrogenase FAD binding subunit